MTGSCHASGSTCCLGPRRRRVWRSRPAGARRHAAGAAGSTGHERESRQQSEPCRAHSCLKPRTGIECLQQVRDMAPVGAQRYAQQPCADFVLVSSAQQSHHLQKDRAVPPLEQWQQVQIPGRPPGAVRFPGSPAPALISSSTCHGRDRFVTFTVTERPDNFGNGRRPQYHAQGPPALPGSCRESDQSQQ